MMVINKPIDLLEIFDSINEEYFAGRCCAGIGFRNSRLGKKTNTLGVCETTERFIRINSVLADDRVPVYVVEYVVYHEMLHLIYGVKHDKRFDREEKKFYMYEEALAFVNGELQDILEEYRVNRYGS